MRANAWQMGFLSTRVGRRTLAHFLGAALLPVMVVAVLGLLFVRRTLETESIRRVQQTAQSVSLLLLGGLTGVAREFAARSAGHTTYGVGDSLSQDEDAHLRAGSILLRAVADPRDATGDANVQQLRRLPNGRVATEVIRPALLWESLEELVSTEHARFCVFAVDTWQRIHCSPDVFAQEATRLRAVAVSAGGREGAQVSGDEYIAHRDIFLRFQFGAAEWRIVSAEARSDVLDSSSHFTTTLGILLALAVVTAFALGHRQIRRSTEPLEALRDATRRVMRGDLQTPLQIGSRDEYGELGAAFNMMTGALDRQLGLLRSMDAVDEAALRERHVDAIVETALGRFCGTRGCTQVSIAIVIAPDAHTMTLWCIDPRAPQPTRRSATLSDAERRELLAHPRCVVLLENAPVRSYAGHSQAIAEPTQRLVLSLIHDAELLGVITLDVSHDTVDRTDDIASAQRMADRVALGLANVRLLERLDDLTLGTIKAFARAIDANSPWTAGHSERVTQLAVALGRELALSEPELATLYRGGLMHDIGKIGIPATVLDKQGALSVEELALMRRHPEIGEQILTSLSAFREALPIVRSHHERVDGRGYPDGLVGEAIPWLARVLAVADVFDALVSDRPYRAGLSQRAAITIIETDTGTHFDPRVVIALLALDAAGRLSEVSGRTRATTTHPAFTRSPALAAV